MTHRAESILAAVTTTVTDLTTTGSNVVRGLVYPRDVDYALSVDMGPEIPIKEPNASYQDCYLEVQITAYVKDTGGVDTALNKIEAEVYAAMMADYTQGLDYVQNTQWMGRESPNREAMEKKSAIQTTVYRIYYRHSYTSAES